MAGTATTNYSSFYTRPEKNEKKSEKIDKEQLMEINKNATS